MGSALAGAGVGTAIVGGRVAQLHTLAGLPHARQMAAEGRYRRPHPGQARGAAAPPWYAMDAKRATAPHSGRGQTAS